MLTDNNYFMLVRKLQFIYVTVYSYFISGLLHNDIKDIRS